MTDPADVIYPINEPWSEELQKRIAASEAAETWRAIVAESYDVERNEPTKKFLKVVVPLRESLPAGEFEEVLRAIAPLTQANRTGPTHEKHFENVYYGFGGTDEGARYFACESENILRGLIAAGYGLEDDWFVEALGTFFFAGDEEIGFNTRASAGLATSSLKALATLKNAKVAGQLAELKKKASGKVPRKQIDKILTERTQAMLANAAVEGEDGDELPLPYGLTGVGVREQPIGDSVAVLELLPTGKTSLSFTTEGPKGPKTVKSVPAKLKTSHADDIADLKDTAKQLKAAFVPVRDEIESLLAASDPMTLETWRASYFDHPIAGVVGRQLVWSLQRDGETIEVLQHDDWLRDLDGQPVRGLNKPNITVRLWHPLDAPETRDAWRDRIEEWGIEQPFPQVTRPFITPQDAAATLAQLKDRLLSQRAAQQFAKKHNWNLSQRTTFSEGSERPAYKVFCGGYGRAELPLDGLYGSDDFAKAEREGWIEGGFFLNYLGVGDPQLIDMQPATLKKAIAAGTPMKRRPKPPSARARSGEAVAPEHLPPRLVSEMLTEMRALVEHAETEPPKGKD